MKKKIWIAIGVAGLILLMTGISVYRQIFAEGPVVHTEKVKQEEISSTIMVPGTLSLQEVQKVYLSQEMGEIKEILVQEGQQVKKGEALLKLENPQLELEVEQNKLSVESGYLKINQINKQIDTINQKQKELVKQIGEKEAKEQLSAEIEQLNMEKKLADLELKQVLLQKDALVKRQEELQVISQMDGTVLSVNNQAMSTLAGSNQEPVIYIGNLGVMVATGVLSEYDTLKVSAGQKVTLTSDAAPGEIYEGEVLKISAIPKESSVVIQGESQAVQYPVTVKVNSANIKLKPGFQLIMEIETEKKNSLVIPVQALSSEGDQSFVYIVKNHKAHRQKVQAGVTSGDKVEIIKGLKVNDTVIVDPGDELTEGMEVRTK